MPPVNFGDLNCLPRRLDCSPAVFRSIRLLLRLTFRVGKLFGTAVPLVKPLLLSIK